ncbi:M20 metallopeptidase family protein [Planococcus salinus]|uniref:Amidohydrolase n=1 Tax=Planococcus salinus TaxID=1848460 RepID=A0A3M8PAP9_9BACL|nr:M20 family metallopeptidase [Planococcus salinus]RNF40264.1 amidohydrolase [Planococcus salinus]
MTIYERVKEVRRALHEQPELGGEEWETSKRIQDELTNAGIPFKTGFAKTGVLGIIEGGSEGGTVALRADIDALPILEKTDVEFKSKVDGKMHACGHDAHTAMLLGTAFKLQEKKSEFPGRVLLVFQPNEETSPIGGARPMMEDGVFDEYKPDVIFGQHVWPSLPVGQIGVRDKEMMGASDTLSFTIKGVGGHASMPHLGKDAVVVTAEFISALQSIVSRNVNPLESAVITIGTINGGYRYNVIADQVELKGTVRTYSQEAKKTVKQRMENLVKGFETAYEVEIDFKYVDGYDATINTPEWAKLVRETAAETLGGESIPEVEPSMAGEDFSRFLKEIPGAFYWLGCAREGVDIQKALHDPEFYFNEDAIKVGVDTMTNVTLSALQKLTAVDS